MAKLCSNSGDTDQMLHFTASDLGLHCLPITLLGVSRLKWVNSMPLIKISVMVACLFLLLVNFINDNSMYSLKKGS